MLSLKPFNDRRVLRVFFNLEFNQLLASKYFRALVLRLINGIHSIPEKKHRFNIALVEHLMHFSFVNPLLNF